MAMAAGRPLIEQLEAIRPDGLSWNAWALKAGVSRTIFNDVRKRNNIRHDSLVKLLSAIDVSLADFETRSAPVRTEVRGTGMSPGEAESAWAMRGPRVKPVPLLGSAFGSDLEGLDGIETTELLLSEVLDHVARPPSLANDDDAYAVTIVNDSMAPRFEAGEVAFVSPRSPVSSGDDVIVQLRDLNDGDQLAGRITQVLIKRLVRRTAKFLELRQFNPDRTFQVPIEMVRRIHRVKGRL